MFNRADGVPIEVPVSRGDMIEGFVENVNGQEMLMFRVVPADEAQHFIDDGVLHTQVGG